MIRKSRKLLGIELATPLSAVSTEGPFTLDEVYLRMIARVEAMPQNQEGADKSGVWECLENSRRAIPATLPKIGTCGLGPAPDRAVPSLSGAKRPRIPAMSNLEPDLVVVKRLSDPASAKLVAQILRSEKIPTFVNGADLLDEFAMSQMMLGNVACEVQVPREHEEQAKEVLAAAKQAGKHLAESEEWRDEDRDGDGDT